MHVHAKVRKHVRLFMSVCVYGCVATCFIFMSCLRTFVTDPVQANRGMSLMSHKSFTPSTSNLQIEAVDAMVRFMQIENV